MPGKSIVVELEGRTDLRLPTTPVQKLPFIEEAVNENELQWIFQPHVRGAGS